MNYDITLQTVLPLTLAAVRVSVPAGGVAAAWKPALDKVWAFVRRNQVSNTGLNVFLYHHSGYPGAGLTVDFGVQVSKVFEGDGDITCVTTPGGEVAQTIHIGPYSCLGDAHAAVQRWCETNQRISSVSWEIYGHWNSDPQKLETSICYLLA